MNDVRSRRVAVALAGLLRAVGAGAVEEGEAGATPATAARAGRIAPALAG